VSLHEFNSLDVKKQTEIVWEKGILESHKSDIKFYYLVYRIDDFFAEIAFNNKTDEIVEIKSFS
jgi:hypothetical protein